MAIIEADAAPQTPYERAVAETQRYFDSPRFEGIIRLY
jgi:isocitrate lyase